MGAICYVLLLASSSYLFVSQSFTSVKDVLISCARRSLAYPLYRHWSLVAAVLQDTKEIFALGTWFNGPFLCSDWESGWPVQRTTSRRALA